MKFAVYQDGEVTEELRLDDEPSEQVILDVLENAGLLDDFENVEEFSIESEPVGNSDFPLAFFVYTEDGDDVAELWPDGYGPDDENEDDESQGDDLSDLPGVIEGEFTEVH